MSLSSAHLVFERDIEHGFERVHNGLEAPQYARDITQVGFEPISSHDLARGFADYNRGLGIPEKTQTRFDELLWTMGEKDWRTADHCRRVGGYAGAIIKKIGGRQFGTPYHESVGRLSGGVHDLGKLWTPAGTIHRSWGDEGHGRWDDIEDMVATRQHPEDGFNLLLNEPALPEEARFPAGCHHAYPDPTRPDRPPYGIDLSVIDTVYKDNPDARAWVHFLVKVTVLADVIDSVTKREDSYIDKNADLNAYLAARIDQFFPEQRQAILEATAEEQRQYFMAPQYSSV